MLQEDMQIKSGIFQNKAITVAPGKIAATWIAHLQEADS